MENLPTAADSALEENEIVLITCQDWTEFCDIEAAAAAHRFADRIVAFMSTTPVYTGTAVKFASKFVELFMFHFGISTLRHAELVQNTVADTRVLVEPVDFGSVESLMNGSTVLCETTDLDDDQIDNKSEVVSLENNAGEQDEEASIVNLPETMYNHFQCSLCHKQFRRQRTAQQHIEIHSGATPFKCPVCKKEFAIKDSLYTHIRNHVIRAGEPMYTCDTCNKQFYTSRNLKVHREAHSAEKTYKCSVCTLSFVRARTCRKHLAKMHSRVKAYSCEVCREMFYVEKELKAHAAAVHSRKTPSRRECRFKCAVCANTFRTLSSLALHQRSIHRDEAELELSKQFDEQKERVMEKLFVKQEIKDIDTQTDETEFPYQCGACSHGFNDAIVYSQHMKIIHSAKRSYKCSVCDETFYSHNDHRIHMQSHPDLRPFLCHICSKSYKQESGLTQHMRLHTGERPYECHICHKCFPYASSLKMHLVMHAGDKSHTCHVCGRAFLHRCHLLTHLRYHTGERRFKCEVCGMTFMVKGSLNMHMLTHSGVRPHRCDVCAQTFVRSHHLVNHRRKAHSH